MPFSLQKQSRKDFLRNLAVLLATTVAVVVFLKNIFLYLFPPRRKKIYHKYLVCKEGEIPIGKAKQIMIGRTPVYVVHLESGYKVFSGICTHLGCIVRWEEEKERFFCPCHKGIYDKNGRVISGPPPRPLDEFQVEIEKDLVYMYVEEELRSPWS